MVSIVLLFTGLIVRNTYNSNKVMHYMQKNIKVGMSQEEINEIRNKFWPKGLRNEPDAWIGVWPPNGNDYHSRPPKLPKELDSFIPSGESKYDSYYVNNNNEKLVIYTPMHKWYTQGEELFAKNILIVSDVETSKIKKIYVVNENFKVKKVYN